VVTTIKLSSEASNKRWQKKNQIKNHATLHNRDEKIDLFLRPLKKEKGWCVKGGIWIPF